MISDIDQTPQLPQNAVIASSGLLNENINLKQNKYATIKRIQIRGYDELKCRSSNKIIQLYRGL